MMTMNAREGEIWDEYYGANDLSAKGKDYIDGFLFAVGRPKAIFPGKLRLVYA